jgi:cytochrome P450
VDWYLSSEGQQHIPELQRVALADPSEETDALLLGYAMEGIRLAGTFGLYRRAAVADTIKEDDGRELHIQAGDCVFVSSASASHEEAYFPEANTVNPRRPIDSYLLYSAGPQASLGHEVTHVALVELFRALFRRRGLKRVPGALGELKKIPTPGGNFVYMTEDWGGVSPFPCNMKVTWDNA